MPKLPSISELTNKVKSAVDSLMVPSTSLATEEAMAKESDPTRAKLLEIELLINQLQDVQVIQTKTINSLKTKYAALHKLVQTTLLEKTDETTSTAPEADDTHRNTETDVETVAKPKPDVTAKNKKNPE